VLDNQEVKYRQAVTSTLVFSDAAHRERWMRMLQCPLHLDKKAQNVTYIVGPIAGYSFVTDLERIARLKSTLETALKHIPKTDWAIFLEKLPPKMRVEACKMINEEVLGACPDPDSDYDEPF
jgi:hypothetical protein